MVGMFHVFLTGAFSSRERLPCYLGHGGVLTSVLPLRLPGSAFSSVSVSVDNVDHLSLYEIEVLSDGVTIYTLYLPVGAEFVEDDGLHVSFHSPISVRVSVASGLCSGVVGFTAMRVYLGGA